MADPLNPSLRQSAPSSAGGQLREAAASDTRAPADSVPDREALFQTLPARVGRYEVECLLGREATGDLYLALDHQLHRKVTLKFPRLQEFGSRLILQRLEVEAKVAARLDHPCLCKVYDTGEFDGHCFIVMQYVEGETLRSHLERSQLAPGEAAALIISLAEGFAEAHRLGIIHRNLKPENIILNRRNQPVIVDFGLAKLETVSDRAAITHPGDLIGSPAYLSPEQADPNLGEIDQQSDLYALGVILFELLTGRCPFVGPPLQMLAEKAQNDPPSPASFEPSIPAELSAICHRMIARNRSERYRNLSEVVIDLEEIQASGTLVLSETAEALIDFDSRPSRIVSPVVLRELRGRVTGQGRYGTRKFRWPLLTAGFLTAVMFGALAMGVIYYWPTEYGVVQIDIEDPSLEVRLDGKSITVDNDGRPIQVRPTATHTFEVVHNGLTIQSSSRKLVISSQERRRLTVRLLEGQVVVDDGTHPRLKMLPDAELKSVPADASPPTVAGKAAMEKATVEKAAPLPVVSQTIPVDVPQPPAGFVSLFNGRDLTGWIIDGGDPQSWEVRDGMLIAHGTTLTARNYLLSKQEYSDFVLRCEYSLDERTGSGIALRAIPGEYLPHPAGNRIFEHPLFKLCSKPYRSEHTGTIHWLRDRTHVHPDIPADIRPAGEWNQVEIEMSGNQMRASVNGQKILETSLAPTIVFADGTLPGLNRALGHIGFQKQLGTARFRRIEIKELGKHEQEAVPTVTDSNPAEQGK